MNGVPRARAAVGAVAMAAKGAAAVMGYAELAARTMELPSEGDRRLAQFLREVDETDMVWLDEIYEEAVKMFVRYLHTPLGPGPYRPPFALIPP